MRWIRQFGRFWYDFVVGDDWVAAVEVGAALGVTALLASWNVNAWWLLPVAVAAILASSVQREAAQHRRRTEPDRDHAEGSVDD